MNDKNRVAYFHVGLPKTASTFLQRRVFPHFKNIHYIKKHDFKRHEDLVRKSPYQSILLSIELIPHPGNESAQEKIDRVNKNFDNVYPILILRHHSSWLRSRYKYYIRKHGREEFPDYIDAKTPQGREILQILHFYPKIKHLEKSFGQRPLVLFQEELKKAPIDTIKVIAEHTGASFNEKDIKLSTVKKSYSEHQLKWVRKFNRTYTYRPKAIKSRFGRKLYKKTIQFFLHAIAYTGNILPDPEHGTDLIPDQQLKKIDEEYQNDWQKCVDYARETRQLHF